MTNKIAENITRIDILRHGHCHGGEIFRGVTDVTLSEQGWEQMRVAMTEFKDYQIIISSPLKRCQAFAAQFSERDNSELERPYLVFDQNLREISFGDWDGKPVVNIKQEMPDNLAAFWQNPLSFTPPNGESAVDFSERVWRCWQQIIQEYRGQRILLVTHGAVIRMLFCKLLNIPMTSFSNISVGYASLSRFSYYLKDDCADWLQMNFHRG